MKIDCSMEKHSYRQHRVCLACFILLKYRKWINILYRISPPPPPRPFFFFKQSITDIMNIFDEIKASEEINAIFPFPTFGGALSNRDFFYFNSITYRSHLADFTHLAWFSEYMRYFGNPVCRANSVISRSLSSDFFAVICFYFICIMASGSKAFSCFISCVKAESFSEILLGLSF